MSRSPDPTFTTRPLPVAIVGAGFIADYHLGALTRIPELVVDSIVDTNTAAAAASQQRWNIANRYESIDDLLRENKPAVAHLATPPHTHGALAKTLLEAGVSVFAEKPMCLTRSELAELHQAASKSAVRLGVNHNAIAFPAFAKLKRDIDKGAIGKIVHLTVSVNAPMRQLEANQFGHWAFADPGNLAFESLYHPFSQIYDLLGETLDLSVIVSGERQLTQSRAIYDTWTVDMTCERGTAQLYFSCANPFPLYSISALGTEGYVQADVLNSAYAFRGRSQHPWYLDTLKWNASAGLRLITNGLANAFGFITSTLKLTRSNDPFTASINTSIHEFYNSILRGDAAPRSFDAGRAVVEMCLRSIEQIPDLSKPQKAAERPMKTQSSDILVLGANGFMGQHLTAALVAEGYNVRVMMRRPDLLPLSLANLGIDVAQGDIMDSSSLQRAMAGCHTVYHLAGTAADSWEASKALIVDGTNNVASQCKASGVARLIYTSTIAAYYLGDATPVREDTPLDPQSDERSFYARAKLESEQELRRFEANTEVEVLIFRPGVVVGAGGRPMHSAVGLWANPGHVTGWGTGRLPMPLVLVDDCADALVRVADPQFHPEIRSFNLVGDVRLSPREYVRVLADATGRKISFHSNPIGKLFVTEVFKWLIKLVVRPGKVDFPSYRDLATRVQSAPFDTRQTKSVLTWDPETDPARFVERAVGYLSTAGTDETAPCATESEPRAVATVEHIERLDG